MVITGSHGIYILMVNWYGSMQVSYSALSFRYWNGLAVRPLNCWGLIRRHLDCTVIWFGQCWVSVFFIVTTIFYFLKVVFHFCVCLFTHLIKHCHSKTVWNLVWSMLGWFNAYFIDWVCYGICYICYIVTFVTFVTIVTLNLWLCDL